MDTWTIGWSDDPHTTAPLLPHADRVRQSVPGGCVRAVLVVVHGFRGVTPEAVLVAWDDERATVRLADGELRWFEDATSFAFPRDGAIVVRPAHGSVYPLDNRYMDVLAVRSLDDLCDTINADSVVSVDDDGTIHVYGEDDDSHAEVTRDPDTGIILRASGIEGARRWRFEVLATRLLDDGQGLLGRGDKAPPAL